MLLVVHQRIDFKKVVQENMVFTWKCPVCRCFGTLILIYVLVDQNPSGAGLITRFAAIRF